MIYATRSDIEAMYGPALLQTLVADDLDLDAAVARACSASSAEMDVYLGRRYALPLTSPSDVLTTWCVDLTCWRLAPTTAASSDEIRKRADRVLTILKDVAEGRGNVPGLDTALLSGGAGEVSASSGTGAAFSARQRRWGGTGGGL